MMMIIHHDIDIASYCLGDAFTQLKWQTVYCQGDEEMKRSYSNMTEEFILHQCSLQSIFFLIGPLNKSKLTPVAWLELWPLTHSSCSLICITSLHLSPGISWRLFQMFQRHFVYRAQHAKRLIVSSSGIQEVGQGDWQNFISPDLDHLASDA